MQGGRHAVVPVGPLGPSRQMRGEIRWNERREAVAETEIVENERERTSNVLRMPALPQRLVAETDAEDACRGGGARRRQERLVIDGLELRTPSGSEEREGAE